MAARSTDDPVLEVRDLQTHFGSEAGTVRAVDGVSLTVSPGRTFGLVGESGCGKTVLALSIIRLVPSPPGRIVGGEVRLDGRDLLGLSEADMRQIRGRDVSMIFQEPMTSLNPVFRVGDQIAEVLTLHEGLGRRAAIAASVDLLGKVGIPSPYRRIRDYPHQMSGGMRQRVMIAMALACRPRLMLADEPTTALDVTIQAQVIDLLNRLQEETGTAILMITHDLGVVAESAQDVAVMYAGRIVEQCSVRRLFDTPRHPYTRGLLASIPSLDGPIGRETLLTAIPGSVPSLNALPKGCAFLDRCPERIPHCACEAPPLTSVEGDHQVRCWRHGSQG